jgi:hypothetical protein
MRVKNILVIILFFLLMINCDKGQGMKNIWEKLNNTTWKISNDSTAYSYTCSFFEDEEDKIKMLWQVPGSGFYVVDNELYFITDIFDENDFFLIHYQEIDPNLIVDVVPKIYSLELKKNQKHSNQLEIYNRMRRVDTDIVRSKYFKAEDINKYSNINEYDKLHKTYVITAKIVGRENLKTLIKKDDNNKSRGKIAKKLTYFVTYPQIFYGSILTVYYNYNLDKKFWNQSRKDTTTFKVQKYHLLKYLEKDAAKLNLTYDEDELNTLEKVDKILAVDTKSKEKNTYLTHENFDKIVGFLTTNTPNIKQLHYYFFDNYEVKYYTNVTRNNKNVGILLIEYRFTKEPLLVYKYDEKLKWGMECMVEKAGTNSLNKVQQHGTPTDFFDVNNWFKEILENITIKNEHYTPKN